MLGGIISYLVKKFSKQSEISQQRGILLSSGLVAGDACLGIVAALLTVLKCIDPNKPAILNDNLGFLFFILLAIFLVAVSLKKEKIKKSHGK